MAMTVYSGVPGLIRNGVGRLWYRLMIVAASFAMLVGWLMLGNNSVPWIPYKNWLVQPDGVRLFRHAPFKRLCARTPAIMPRACWCCALIRLGSRRGSG